MKLHEYEAKDIYANFAIPVPKQLGVATRDDRQVPVVQFPVVIKSQVPVGGRGKLGGIRVVQTPDDMNAIVDELFALEIKGYRPRSLLIEEALQIKNEYYLSISVNRTSAAIEVMAHRNGGIEIEGHDRDEFLVYPITATTTNKVGELVAEKFDLPGHTFAIQDIVSRLYKCLIDSDALLAEINPLILTNDNRLIAGDAKMTLDDAAAFRHPEWSFEEQASDTNFISLNPHGTIATIANGAGLAMATVDTVAQRDLTPANFLDIGGGATVESIVASFQRIMEFRHITHIVINIFGGIVQCDKVAEAIIEARKQLPDLPRLLIRLSGTNSERAREILAQHDLTLYESLDQALQEVSS